MVGERYFQHQTVPVISGKTNEKSGFEIIKKRYFEIWISFYKNFDFVFNTYQVFRTL